MRSTGQKIHDPFSVRAPPPPTQPRNGHEGWWILLPARKRRFSLICPTIKHTTESTLADTFYRRARSDVLLSRERERVIEIESEKEREITLSFIQVAEGVRLPPETLWRRVFPFACSSSPSSFLSSFVGREGEGYISSRGYFLSLSSTIPPAVLSVPPCGI